MHPQPRSENLPKNLVMSFNLILNTRKERNLYASTTRPMNFIPTVNGGTEGGISEGSSFFLKNVNVLTRWRGGNHFE
jgi:hypothetical protein